VAVAVHLFLATQKERLQQHLSLYKSAYAQCSRLRETPIPRFFLQYNDPGRSLYLVEYVRVISGQW